MVIRLSGVVIDKGGTLASLTALIIAQIGLEILTFAFLVLDILDKAVEKCRTVWRDAGFRREVGAFKLQRMVLYGYSTSDQTLSRHFRPTRLIRKRKYWCAHGQRETEQPRLLLRIPRIALRQIRTDYLLEDSDRFELRLRWRRTPRTETCMDGSRCCGSSPWCGVHICGWYFAEFTYVYLVKLQARVQCN